MLVRKTSTPLALCISKSLAAPLGTASKVFLDKDIAIGIVGQDKSEHLSGPRVVNGDDLSYPVEGTIAE